MNYRCKNDLEKPSALAGMLLCSRIGCERKAQVRALVKLYAPAIFGPHAPCEMRIDSLPLCQRCARQETPQTFITDEAWDVITDLIVRAGRTPPDRGRTELHWESITSN